VQADFFVAGGDPAPTGELVNLALYPIDAVLTLLDLPVHRVHAVGGPDVVTVLLDLANDVTATVACGRTAAVGGLPASGVAVHRYRISGSHGVLAVDATRPALRLRNAAGQQRAWTGPSTVDALLDALAVAVRTGRTDPGPDDAVRAQRVIDAARRALETGAPVDISESRE
jgi:predicted dehydrogenase